jgi:hypothetical protein
MSRFFVNPVHHAHVPVPIHTVIPINSILSATSTCPFTNSTTIQPLLPSTTFALDHICRQPFQFYTKSIKLIIIQFASLSSKLYMSRVHLLTLSITRLCPCPYCIPIDSILTATILLTLEERIRATDADHSNADH